MTAEYSKIRKRQKLHKIGKNIIQNIEYSKNVFMGMGGTEASTSSPISKVRGKPGYLGGIFGCLEALRGAPKVMEG